MAYYEIPGEMWVILTLLEQRMNTALSLSHTPHHHTHTRVNLALSFMSDTEQPDLFSSDLIYSYVCRSLVIAAVVFSSGGPDGSVSSGPDSLHHLCGFSLLVPPRQDTLTCNCLLALSFEHTVNCSAPLGWRA